MATEQQSVEEKVEELFTKDIVEEEPSEFDPVKPEVLEDADSEVEQSEETDGQLVEKSEEAKTEETEDGLQYVEVEYDGNVYEVPENLKDALLRQSDYTTKTQEVASQRKEVEVQLGTLKQQQDEFQFVQSIQGDVLKAQQLEAQANQFHEYLRSNIDNLSSTDIEKLRLAVDDARRERDQIVQSVQQKQGEFQQAQEQSYAELLNKGTEVLRQKIPGWGEKEQNRLREYALSSGITEAEISQLVDPRHVEMIWKASQYDALKAGAAPAVRKVQTAPSIKEKSRNPMPEDVKQKLNLRKKLKSRKLGSREKARLIQENIGERWG